MIAYLPKLKAGTEQTLQLPSKAGLWEERDSKTALAQLARSLEVPMSENPIHSVPDVWARAILFSNALYHKDHTLHEQYLGEWRGMMAILALRQIEQYNWLHVLKLDLPTPQIDKARTEPLDFLEVAGRLKPVGASIAPEANWDSVYLFYRQMAGEGGQDPLAFSSAMTLVCTGANSRVALDGLGIPWFNGKTLEDPVRKLKEGRKIQVAEWIMVVRQIIGDRASTGTNLTGPLLTLLKEFARDLHEPTSNREKFEAKEIDVILSDLPADMPLTGKLWMVLGQAHPGEGGGRSDLDLDLGPERAERYIVMDEDFARQLERDPHEVRVFNDITLGSVRSQVSGYDAYPTGEFGEGVKWITKNFFFNDAMIAARGAAPFPAAGEMKTIGQKVPFVGVPPMAEAARRLLGLDYLLENTLITWESKERAVVSLQLKLKTGKTIKVTKAYSGTQLVIVDLTDHLLGIWPNFTRTKGDWHVYYLHHSWPASARSIKVEVKPIDVQNARDRSHTEQHESATSHFRVLRMPSFPRAIELKLTSNAETGHTGLAAGILPLKPPPSKGGGSPAELTVGVDFGSTGSNVYYRLPGFEPEKLTFEGRIYSLNNNDATAAVRYLREFIRDSSRPAFNLLTVFQDFLADRSHEREVLLDGHILDLQEPEEFSGELYGKVHTDLKWKGIAQKYIAQDFLYQLMLETAAEAVERNAMTVEVRFSYPTAYSDGDLEYFRRSWQRIVERVHKDTGVAMVLGDNKLDCRESIAAARFFAHSSNPRKIDFGQGGLTIDIGGGTSDYAFYHKRALKGHTSVLFAGRDIFLAPLRRHHRVLHKIADLRSKASIKALDDLRNADVEKFNAYLDAVVQRYGNDYKRELHVVNEVPEVAEFLNILSIGLCGVLFYGGMVVRLLKAKDVALPPTFRIHIGGNGCQMFDWLFQGSETFVEHDVHYRNAVSAFRAGAGAPPDQGVELIRSSQPKAEVAFGLLDDSHSIDVAVERAVEFAGEIHTIDSQIISWDRPVDASAVMNKTLYIDRRLLIFNQFLKSIGVGMDKRTLDDLAVSVDNKINQLKVEQGEAAVPAAALIPDPGIDPFADPATWSSPAAAAAAPNAAEATTAAKPASKLLRSEPLFIMTLKQYLDDRIRGWVQKYAAH